MIDAGLLATLPALAFQAVLVFARMGAAVMVLPGLGEQEIPAPVRLGIGLCLVPLVLAPIAAGLPGAPDSALVAARLVGVEVLVGLWLGGIARLLVMALAMAGQLAAAMMGLASVLVPDAAFGAQSSALSRLMGLLAAVMLLSSGLFAMPLAALVGSYEVLPVGAGFPAGDAAQALVAAGAASLELALRLAAPFILGGVVLNLALGLLARLAPSIQVYFVAVPGQILAGIALFGLLLPAMLGLLAAALRDSFASLPGAS